MRVERGREGEGGGVGVEEEAEEGEGMRARARFLLLPWILTFMQRSVPEAPRGPRTP